MTSKQHLYFIVNEVDSLSMNSSYKRNNFFTEKVGNREEKIVQGIDTCLERYRDPLSIIVLFSLVYFFSALRCQISLFLKSFFKMEKYHLFSTENLTEKSFVSQEYCFC